MFEIFSKYLIHGTLLHQIFQDSISMQLWLLELFRQFLSMTLTDDCEGDVDEDDDVRKNVMEKRNNKWNNRLITVWRYGSARFEYISNSSSWRAQCANDHFAFSILAFSYAYNHYHHFELCTSLKQITSVLMMMMNDWICCCSDAWVWYITHQH